MKKILILLAAIMLPLFGFSQTLIGDRGYFRDSVYVNGKWVKAVSADTTLGDGADNVLPTQGAVKGALNDAMYRLKRYAQPRMINLSSDNYYSKFDSISFHRGTINNQNDWVNSSKIYLDGFKWVSNYNAIITDTSLSTFFPGQIGAILKNNFYSGEILLSLKGDSRFLIGINYRHRDSAFYAVWSPNSTTLSFGLASVDNYNYLDTVNIRSVQIPDVSNVQSYLLKISKGLANGNTVKVSIYADSVWNSYSFQIRKHNMNRQGYISLSSIDDTSTYYSIEVKKSDRNIYTKATLIGNWFPRYANDTFNISTITSGSGIRFRVSGTKNVGLKFSIGYPVSKYPPIADIYVKSVGSRQWQQFRRDTIYPSTSNTGNYNVLNIASNLNVSKDYDLKVIFDITPFDSLWKYGGSVLLNNIIVDNGGDVTSSIRDAAPIIMGIGNSITAGVLQIRNPDSWPVSTSRNLLSYNNYLHILCDSLNAIPFNQAYGATGLYRDGSGGIPTTIATLKHFMYGVQRNSITPSLILINVGTNDNVSNGKFYTGYMNLLGFLKKIYPTSVLVGMRPFNGDYEDEIKEACYVQNIYYMNTTGWGITFTPGQTLHPDTAGQRVAADSILNWIRKRNIKLIYSSKKYSTPNDIILRKAIHYVSNSVNDGNKATIQQHVDLDTISNVSFSLIPLKGSLHLPNSVGGALLSIHNGARDIPGLGFQMYADFIDNTQYFPYHKKALWYRTDSAGIFTDWKMLITNLNLRDSLDVLRDSISSMLPIFNGDTLSGDGSTSTFTVSISPGFTPSQIIIQPTSEDAAKAQFWVEESLTTATSFTVKASGVVPPSGTGNITFRYELIK